MEKRRALSERAARVRVVPLSFVLLLGEQKKGT